MRSTSRSVTNCSMSRGNSRSDDLRLDQPHASQRPPQGDDDVRRVEIAGCHLVEHGCEQHEVLAADQHDLKVRLTRQRSLQPPRRMESREAATENHYASSVSLP